MTTPTWTFVEKSSGRLGPARGRYTFRGERFDVTGIHPRGHVQSLRRATLTALRQGRRARAQAALDLMVELDRYYGLGYLEAERRPR